MTLQVQKATTIAEVIAQLDRIIDWAIGASDRIGYFACLYRKVTVAVQQGIESGRFEDGPRMERLDVVFANRFLEAFRQYLSQEPCSTSWLLAFEQARAWRPLVLQHLMLGMNAHINVDLGIAAAETMRGKDIMQIRNDFLTINDILLDLIDEVQDQLAEIFPLFKRIDAIGRFDEILAGAGINLARQQAWSIALAFAGYSDEEREDKIRELDEKIVKTGHHILLPGKGLWLQLGLFATRLGEYHSISKKITLLR